MTRPSLHPIHLTVPTEAHGRRLDQWLAAQFPEQSRSALQRWIKEGRVLVDGQSAKSSLKLETEHTVLIHPLAPPSETTLQPEPIPLDIVYENDDLLVINKPAGMVVHPAPGHVGGTLVNAVLHHCPHIEGVGGELRPGIVHRLDKETSGLLVVAKNDATHRFLQSQFQARTVYKEYLALVEGRMEPPRGRISAPIGRHPSERQRQAVLPPDPHSGQSKGRSAITEYETIALYTGSSRDGMGVAHFTLVRAILHTGRTHQIRVHFAWLKHPVVGDTLYGYRKQRLALDRHFLHAQRLRLTLPGATEAREFMAPLPLELQAILAQLEI
ncbi:MAG: RluA family pseudouridine synthase [Caldilineaceae bacterium]